MNNHNHPKPVVLVLAGHDPSGGAGIQADIEAIAAHNCHAATVITALTVQNTQQMIDAVYQDPEQFKRQAVAILEDMNVKAIKIGAIGSIEILQAIVELLEKQVGVPIVLDPVLHASSGYSFTDKTSRKKLMQDLLPLTAVATPNSDEARQLAGTPDSLQDAAKQFLAYGCQHVLITGAHEDTENIENVLYSKNLEPETFVCERLAGEFHGSGCTLSSAIASQLALGESVYDAVAKAHSYTFECLKYAYRAGAGQLIPNRIGWRQKED